MPAPRPSPDEYDPRRWAALVVTMAATVMDLIDGTVLQVALPSLRGELHASSAQLEWTMAGYTLAFAAGMITSSRLGDRYGRLRVFQGGLAAFVVTSLLTGLATGPAMLVVTRIAQGASASLMVPQVLSMLRVEFPPEEQQRAATVYGLTFSIGGVGAPLLGGVLLNADLFGWGWRPIFFVNVPVGVAAFIGTVLLCRDSRSEHAAGIDVPGTLLATTGLLALLYPLVEGRALGWPWWVFAMMAACPPTLWLFVRYERTVVARRGGALIDPAILRERSVVGGLTVAVLFFAGAAYPVVLTVHLQSTVGFSPLHTAVTLVPAAVGVGLFSPFATRLRRLGRPLAMTGCLVLATGMGLTTATVVHYGRDLHSWQLVPGLLVGGLGMSMASGVLIATVVAKTPGRHVGAAAGLVNTALQIGAASGVALIGTVYFGLLDGGHPPVRSAAIGLLVVTGLYLLAAPTTLILPAGRLHFTAARPQRPSPLEASDAGSGDPAPGPAA
ncbi:MFS transporter [Actinoallomurus sp. NPDC052308]|uniref:MFS transporter n=1 Tax=Actinoallomurus sp. NPDC052308 TaxID=3155530 RepID=UPI003446D655